MIPRERDTPQTAESVIIPVPPGGKLPITGNPRAKENVYCESGQFRTDGEVGGSILVNLLDASDLLAAQRAKQEALVAFAQGLRARGLGNTKEDLIRARAPRVTATKAGTLGFAGNGPRSLSWKLQRIATNRQNQPS